MHFRKFLVQMSSNQQKLVLVNPPILGTNQLNQILGNGREIKKETIKIIMNKEQVDNNQVIMIKICMLKLLYTVKRQLIWEQINRSALKRIIKIQKVIKKY